MGAAVKSKHPRSLDEIFSDEEGLNEAFARASRKVRLEHKLLGLPLAEWRDGQVVWVSPEEIDLGPAPAPLNGANSHASDARLPRS
jgi:hypothetical protein